MHDLIAITKQKSVLYVEDHDEMRKSAVILLSQFFDNVVEAKDGKEGISLYKKQLESSNRSFDLVFSDIYMPYINGIELIEEIYKLNKDQKIIVITAYSTKEYLVPLVKIGIENFLQKPVEVTELIEIIQEIATTYWNNDKSIVLNKQCSYNGQSILCNNEVISLTHNEIKLLELFLKHQGRFFTLEEIHNYIFYNEPLKVFSAQAIRSIIKRLRKKIPQECIVNSRTLGYALCI